MRVSHSTGRREFATPRWGLIPPWAKDASIGNRLINARAETAAKVRVAIRFHDQDHSFGTVGVSTNIIEASWMALTDAIEYKLLRQAETHAGE